MNKKRKKILCIVLVTICAIAISQAKPTVVAEGIKDLSEKEECTKLNGDDKYKPNVEPAYHSNGDTYNLKVKSGAFEVYVYEIQYNAQTGTLSPALIDKFALGGSTSKNISYTFARANYPKTYDFVFNLIESDDECEIDPTAEPKRNLDGTWSPGSKLGYVYAHQVEVTSSISDPYFTNIHYNGICSSLRTGDYDSYSEQFSKVNLSKSDFDKYWNKVLGNFSYCNNYLVTVGYKETEVASIIKSIIDRLKLGEIKITGTLKGPSSNDSEIISDTASTDFNMQCPAYQNVNGIQIPNQSSTVKKYYKTVTTVKPDDIYSTIAGNDVSCKKTCEENVTVTYGPPVASKAGLCFEYKVKVESELNCQTEFIGEAPKPEDYQVCTPVGACNSYVYWSASGPNEDFDSCVNSCDGGKYTQKCIDSCYKEVYEDTNTNLLPLNYNEKLAAIENSKIARLVSREDEIYDDILKAKDNIGDGKKYSIDDLKNAVVEASTGRYTVSGSNIIWKPGNRYWERPGRYYTLNITNYTVGRLKTAGTNYWNPTVNQGGLSIVLDDGFLRNNSGSGYCTAACYWHGCSNAKANKYYPTGKVEKATNREFLNSSDAVDVYLHELDNYINAAGECKASATCTSKTTEFTIKVNNKTKTSPEVDNWIDYASSITESGNETATTLNGKALSNTSIILDRNGCYTQEKPSGNAYYMTEWSFPGTWINNKTGKISYQPQESNNGWHLKKEKFCTNLDSKYVNTAWWTQRILQPNTPVDEASKATIDEYNIEATTKNFGYFGWNFKIQCFYALYDAPLPENEGAADDEDTKPLSYKLRTVDLTDIFPNNDDETITADPSATGRTPGYNWTDAATNVKNPDYEVTPGALYPVIQARANEIYNPDKKDQYLDYEFYLTPADLNKIRQYSSKLSGYNIYPGNIKVANGIAYYESALFRSGSTNSFKLGSDSVITLGALGVNNQKRKDNNEAETFENSYTATLKQSRDEYLSNISGGNE